MSESITEPVNDPVPAPIQVLTIDDEAGIRQSIAAYLEDSGFEVRQAENGLVGMQRIREQRPDVILCDLRMPEADGMAVLQMVTEEAPEVPFIVVSGAGVLGEALEALRKGAWDYIPKPIQDMAVLEHTIARAMERARLIRENQTYRGNLETVNQELKARMDHLEEDEQMGRDIQFQLLPEDDWQHNGLCFTHSLLTSLYLSGDFLGYFAIDAQRTGFYVADVSGHGVSSAFVTVLLSSSMNHYMEEYRQGKNRDILQPSTILARLNHSIVNGRVDKYLTMFYAVIDTEDETLTYSNGGQFPYPLLNDGQSTEPLVGKGFPVGLFEFADFEIHRIPLPPSFTLVAFSDGILEVMGYQGLDEKRERLRELVADDQVRLEDITAAIGVSDTRMLPDDITLLMVKRSQDND